MDASGISVLVDKISDHRFDGYTDNMLADEIERFRSGPGISGISDAVSALKEVASALAETEETLRVELGKLGVAWQGAAGDRAGRAVVQQADFSTDARDTVTDAAERIFAQGEAFNRTLHKLPDAQALRDGARGYGLLDSISSLLGFETDNTRKVAQAREARAQALEALNAYARDSGENLSGLREISAPQAVRANTGPVVPREIDAGGGPGEVTTASGAVRAPVAAPASAPGASAPTPAPMSAPATGPAPVSAPGANAPTPAYGTPLPQAPASGSGAGAGSGPARPVVQPTAPQSTAPSSVASVTAAAAGFVGAARHTQQQSSGGAPGTSGVSGAPATPGGPGAPGTTGVPGAVAPGTPGVPGTSEQAPGNAVGSKQPVAPGKPGGAASAPGAGSPGAPGAGATGAPGTVGGTAGAPPAAGLVGKPATQGGANTEQPLAKGKSFGSAPVTGSPQGAAGGTGFAGSPRGGGSVNDIGAGMAALGAGGIAGALAGDNERKGRGVGRSAPSAPRSPHELAIGDLPEEQAKVQRNADRLNPRSERGRGSYLEKAAPQEGADDTTHVRRYGVDDQDLFADQRMVSPDVLGDDPDGRR